MEIKKKIYFWASDISNNSGEGILANSFIKNYLKNNKNIIFKNINYKDKFQKKDSFHLKKERYETTYHKYIHPFIGVFKLWINFINKRKICYINYLPLWNFLLFLLLPPKTIIGPITGNIYRKKIYFKIFNLFEIISILIIKFRFGKVFFSHNFYNVKYNLSNRRFKNNFILKDFYYKKINLKKKYDFIVYFRKKSKLNQYYIFNIIKKLNSIGCNIAIIGDKINLKGNKNFGYISRKKANRIIALSKYSIANPENLYSFFVQDCLSNNVKVFYNNFFKKYEIFGKKKMIPIFFKSYEKDFKIIIKTIKK